MKRYRVIAAEFDTRVLTLQPPEANVSEPEKSMLQQSYGRTLALLKAEYGEFGFEAKLANFQLLQPKPVSVVGFHNQCLEQCRQAFIFGQYYPALTGAFLLAERMLEHLINGLVQRYCKEGIQHNLAVWEQGRDWRIPLELLLTWRAVDQDVADLWLRLHMMLNEKLHADGHDLLHNRELAFEAISIVESIIRQQFAGHGDLPWLFAVNDEYYIRKAFEQHPLIQFVYLPASVQLGYQHKVERIFPWEFHDLEEYPAEDLSDEEFIHLREGFCHQFRLTGQRIIMSA